MPEKLPAALRGLVDHYQFCDQQAVRFRAPSWDAALCDVPGEPTGLLHDDGVTAPSSVARYKRLGDRLVGRDSVERVCSSIEMTSAESGRVVQAFVLVMAWGSGTSNARSYRYTRLALENLLRGQFVLLNTAERLREAMRIDGGELETVYADFSLPGVGSSFFTKWLAFAGRRSDRDWQPLILDRRVIATLNHSLGVRLRDLRRGRNAAGRYAAYVRAMHDWGEALAVPAQRLEWVMFQHNGGVVPPG